MATNHDHNIFNSRFEKIKKISLPIALIAFFCCSGGCAGIQAIGSKAYEAPVLSIPADRTRLMTAAIAHAQKEGWTIVSVDESKGTVEALSRTEESGEFAQRNRWFFKVGKDSITLTKKSEMQFSSDTPGVWVSEDRVCASYGYYSEKHELAKIETSLSQPPTNTILVANNVK